MVSAWAAANGVCPGQEAVAQKSNEIKAIPRLIECLDLSECIITIDAIACQHAIRTHCSIENNLYWQLDVTFNEDSQRKSRNTARNFSLVSKFALMRLRNNLRKGSLSHEAEDGRLGSRLPKRTPRC